MSLMSATGSASLEEWLNISETIPVTPAEAASCLLHSSSPSRQTSAIDDDAVAVPKRAEEKTKARISPRRDGRFPPNYRLAAVGGGAFFLAASAMYLLPIASIAEVSFRWLDEQQQIHPKKVALYFILTYTAGAIFCVPAPLMGLAGGMIFDNKFIAALMVALGSLVGAGVSFLCGRYLFREAVAAKLEKKPIMKALDKAIRRDGLKIVLASRFVVPYAFSNYALGLTAVRFGHFCFATFVSGLPYAAVYSALGADVQEVSHLFRRPGDGKSSSTWSSRVDGQGSSKNWLGKLALMSGGVVALGILIQIATGIAKSAVAEATAEISGKRDCASDKALQVSPSAAEKGKKQL